MKKLFACVISVFLLTMLIVSAVPASAADIYGSANIGDLLYTLSFAGSDVYTPACVEGDMTATVDPTDNTKVTLTSNREKGQSWWGGEIPSLPLGINNAYTITWKAGRLNDTDGSFGVYINYKTNGVYGYITKYELMNGTGAVPTHGYVTYESLGFTPEATTLDGTPQSYALEINAQNQTMKLYVRDNAGEWKLVDKTLAGEIAFPSKTLGLYIYEYYGSKPVTLSDVNIYKGMTISGEVIEEIIETTVEETTAEETPAPETTKTPTTTAKPATTTPSTTKAPSATDTSKTKKSCGSTVYGYVALIPILSGSVILIFKKKH